MRRYNSDVEVAEEALRGFSVSQDCQNVVTTIFIADAVHCPFAIGQWEEYLLFDVLEGVEEAVLRNLSCLIMDLMSDSRSWIYTEVYRKCECEPWF